MKKIFVFVLSILGMFLAMACSGVNTFEPGSVAKELKLRTTPNPTSVNFTVTSTVISDTAGNQDFFDALFPDNKPLATKSFKTGEEVALSGISSNINFTANTYRVKTALLKVVDWEYVMNTATDNAAVSGNGVWTEVDDSEIQYAIVPTLKPNLDTRANVALNTIKDWTVSFPAPADMVMMDEDFFKHGDTNKRYSLDITLEETPLSFVNTPVDTIAPTNTGAVTLFIKDYLMTAEIPLQKDSVSAYAFNSDERAADGTMYTEAFVAANTPLVRIMASDTALNPNTIDTYTHVQYIDGGIADAYVSDARLAYSDAHNSSTNTDFNTDNTKYDAVANVASTAAYVLAYNTNYEASRVSLYASGFATERSDVYRAAHAAYLANNSTGTGAAAAAAAAVVSRAADIAAAGTAATNLAVNTTAADTTAKSAGTTAGAIAGAAARGAAVAVAKDKAGAAAAVVKRPAVLATTYLYNGSVDLSDKVEYRYWMLPVDTTPVAIN